MKAIGAIFQVLLSLSFDEDLVRRKITEMEKKAKKAKNGRNLRQQDQDGLNKKSYNDRKKNRRELIEKTREEVVFLVYLFIVD